MTEQKYVSINGGVITHVTMGHDLQAEISQPQSSAGEWIGWTTQDNGVTFIAPTVPDPSTGTSSTILSPLEFLGLCETAGGMTDAMLVAAHNDANLASLWLKFTYAKEIEKASSLTSNGLDALHATGYLPNGKQAVLDVWPTV